KQRIKAGAAAPSEEIVRDDAEVTPFLPQPLNQVVEAFFCRRNKAEVLVEYGLRGAGIAAPQDCVNVPVQELVAFVMSGELPTALIEIAGHQRKRIAAAEHAIVIQAEAHADQIEQRIDVSFSLGQCLSKYNRFNAVQSTEQSLASKHGIRAGKKEFET